MRELIGSIRTWTQLWNDDPKPFVWHQTADEIEDGAPTVTKARFAHEPSDGSVGQDIGELAAAPLAEVHLAGGGMDIAPPSRLDLRPGEHRLRDVLRPLLGVSAAA